MNDISTEKLSYYSIQFINKPDSEYAIFKKKRFPEHQVELRILKEIIYEMGLRGAKSYYFEKPEKGAFALPSVSPVIKNTNKKDFGIRLYCLFLSPQIVVLLNGDIKTNTKPELCPNVSKLFDNAVKLAMKMKKAQENEFIRCVGLKLESDEDYFLDI